MRKFKVKNRPKRKYVKKNEVPTSLSLTQTITIGMVPLVLMAVAFFATFLITHSLAAPQFSFSMPAIPQPEVHFTAPTLPTLTIPDTRQFFVNSYERLLITLMAFNSALSELVISATASLMTGITVMIQTLIATLHHAFLSAEMDWTNTGQILISSTVQTIHTLQIVMQVIISALLLFADSIRSAAILATDTVKGWLIITANTFMTTMATLGVWITLFANATVKALGDFFLFLGTPFRALGEAWDSLMLLLSPYLEFLRVTFQHGLDDLAAGGESLRQASIYISDSTTTSQ